MPRKMVTGPMQWAERRYTPEAVKEKMRTAARNRWRVVPVKKLQRWLKLLSDVAPSHIDIGGVIAEIDAAISKRR